MLVFRLMNVLISFLRAHEGLEKDGELLSGSFRVAQARSFSECSCEKVRGGTVYCQQNFQSTHG